MLTRNLSLDGFRAYALLDTLHRDTLYFKSLRSSERYGGASKASLNSGRYVRFSIRKMPVVKMQLEYLHPVGVMRAYALCMYKQMGVFAARREEMAMDDPIHCGPYPKHAHVWESIRRIPSPIEIERICANGPDYSTHKLNQSN